MSETKPLLRRYVCLHCPLLNILRPTTCSCSSPFIRPKSTQIPTITKPVYNCLNCGRTFDPVLFPTPNTCRGCQGTIDNLSSVWSYDLLIGWQCNCGCLHLFTDIMELNEKFKRYWWLTEPPQIKMEDFYPDEICAADLSPQFKKLIQERDKIPSSKPCVVSGCGGMLKPDIRDLVLYEIDDSFRNIQNPL